jgi:hypothetical protein
VSNVPEAFQAWEDVAAYVDGRKSRARAITLAREVDWRLTDDYRRDDLLVRRVWMREVKGREAEEFFDGEFDGGWIEVIRRPLTAAQRAHLIPMWKVEPR